MFRESLQKIVDNCEGVIAGVVMGFDGIAVETVAKNKKDVDVNNVAMEFSFVLTQVRKAADILEVGRLDEVAIRAENLTFLVRILSEDYFIGVAMSPDGNFGKGRFLMRVAAPDMRSQL